MTTDDGEIVGGVFAVDHHQYIEIVDLFVNKQFQGQKYGRSLFRDVLNTYPYSTICLRCKAFDDGLSQDELAEWYRRWDFEDGSPFHEGDGWMHKSQRRI
ncbi:MAG: GNAT family N-acetyltransferase [Tolypothrix brevis GSE-NOS-MK-07-07A]|nr:GNAT family N-acetyltransferase [Tolypothrix brevis GSE-NOS-MK-07-07A]